MLQQHFWQFFFNLSDVTAGNGFAAEKFFSLTIFAQRKSCLWKSGGFNFLITHRGGRGELRGWICRSWPVTRDSKTADIG